MPLSAIYDLPHGKGMRIVLPAYLEFMAEVLPSRWAKLARRCFDVTEEDDIKAAKMLSGKVVEWLESTNSYIKLSDVNIGDDNFDKMADDVVRMFPGDAPNTTKGPKSISKEEIVKIYEMCK